MQIDRNRSLVALAPTKRVNFAAATMFALLSSVSVHAACPTAAQMDNTPVGTAAVNNITINVNSNCTWTPNPSTVNRNEGDAQYVTIGELATSSSGFNSFEVSGTNVFNINARTGISANATMYGVYVNSPTDSVATMDSSAASLAANKNSYMRVDNATFNINTDPLRQVANVKVTGIRVDYNGWFFGNDVTFNLAHSLTQWVQSFESYGVLVGGGVGSENYDINFIAHAQFQNLTINMKSTTSGMGSLIGTTMAGIRAIAQSKVGSSGYDSGSGVVVVSGMTTITMSGNYALGIYVSGRNSLVDLNDSSITTAGNNSSAIKLGKYRAAGTGSGQLISRGHMEIDTSASAASSILLIGDADTASGYSPTSLNADFDTSSTNIKSGREAVNYSTLDLTQGGSASGIMASFNNAVMTTVNATASLIKVEGSATYAQTGAVFNLRGSGSALTAAANGWLFEVQNYASLTANIREGEMTGMVTVGGTGASAGEFELNLSDNVVWHLAAKGATTDSTVTRLNLASGATVDASAGDFSIIGDVKSNNGVLDLSGSGKAAGQVLTIRGDYTAGTFAAGTNSTLILDTVLGDSSSLTDKLVLDGGTASGDTLVSVLNAGGLGAQTTGDGILIVEALNGATTTAADFSLGTARVAAGAYEYSLRRGTGLTDNWYLSSTFIPEPPDPTPPDPTPPDPTPPGPELPEYRVEVPVYMVAPALANRLGLAMLGTYHDRNGEDYILPAAPVYQERVIVGRNGKRQTVREAVRGGEQDERRYAGWARLFGETGSVGYGGKGSAYARLDKFWQHGPSYDYDLAGMQAGFDFYRRENAKGTSDIAGLYVAAGRIDSDVQAVYGGKAGSLSMDGYAIGAYWTRKGASGWYIDAVAQAMLFDDVTGSSVKGVGMSTNGWGFTGSLETGYPIALGQGFAIEPQAQLIYQHVSLDNGRDMYGRIAYGDADTLYGRIGARLIRNIQFADNRVLTLWARANLWHTFGADAKTTFTNIYGYNATTLKTDLGGTWAQVGFGASGKVAENVNVFASGDYNFAVGEGRGHGLSGRLGVRVVW